MNIDKQALREVATVATQGGWYIDYDFDVCHESGAFLAETHGDNLAQNAKFIAAANPATILALLDELEHYKSREERVTKLVLDNSASWDALYKKLEAAEKHIAELEARKVNLSKLNVGEVMHMSGFSRDYAEGWCAGNDNAIHEIRTAGIKVKES
ncbi:ead/Ea22-like family protein [Salmonella enterica]|uniref:Ead/Ea22-like family protein n=1 Tax=Salmonella virchow TaxID=48409 RepID=A0A5I9S3N2_SALVI|nr:MULTISPECIES: ead/Ea22-like family protein [Salmonella]EAA7531309.1 ead/Ea22-like family protein [Salmonella enterica subsp. enterica]EAM9794204.1 ead/Ea22-like family protein [Salmonella enterica]EBK1728381.1 ead/Ea22-like family protein [Salmonella enterica subsp. enterica serovar Virchow]EBW8600638.1 ead/Ea22-like family protein [Salmonella enterica subsp. enterica serovar Thompson]ECA7066378.1 ead/Ea22-like family protein [Salmonella enterica subsp. enterica serovar Grumpensis]EDV60819